MQSTELWVPRNCSLLRQARLAALWQVAGLGLEGQRRLQEEGEDALGIESLIVCRAFCVCKAWMS